MAAGQEPQDAVAVLIARVEALEAALAALSGPAGSIVTGTVAVVDEYGRPVVILSPSDRPVEVLKGGKPAVRLEVDAGRSSLHLRHGSAEATLGVRAGTSPGNAENNGALLRLSDGTVGAELAAVHRQEVTGAGLRGDGRADLTLHGSDVHGCPGARVAVVAARNEAEMTLASAADEDRASSIGIYVEHESVDEGFHAGQAFPPVRPTWRG